MSRFKITIEETVTETTECGKVWELGAGATPEEPTKYGYTPSMIKGKKITRTIYTQDVKKLDLSEVIAAVNKK